MIGFSLPVITSTVDQVPCGRGPERAAGDTSHVRGGSRARKRWTRKRGGGTRRGGGGGG